MPAPPAILDALDSVIDIFFSGVRHRERAAYILCDNLVEMACKTRALEHNYTFNMRCGFHDAWNAPGVALPPAGLGGRVQGYREARNNMQHGSAAATVDHEHCATAIVDASQVIGHCWPGALAVGVLPLHMSRALRIAALYCSGSDVAKRPDFERLMERKKWRTRDAETVKANGRQIEPGKRDHWWIAIRMQGALVEECLNQIGL